MQYFNLKIGSRDFNGTCTNSGRPQIPPLFRSAFNNIKVTVTLDF
jgi:hypothetical protein